VFDIPLNDTGSAGLGISVKGRRALFPDVDGSTAYADCGIYIKTVMHGGAAYKVCRITETHKCQVLDLQEIS
jgi:partitioning defective protein 3